MCRDSIKNMEIIDSIPLGTPPPTLGLGVTATPAGTVDFNFRRRSRKHVEAFLTELSEIPWVGVRLGVYQPIKRTHLDGSLTLTSTVCGWLSARADRNPLETPSEWDLAS